MVEIFWSKIFTGISNIILFIFFYFYFFFVRHNSLSGSVNKRLEVLVTPKTRLSLKKVVYLNARVNMNVEGSKQESQVTYTIKLPDSEEKSLFTLE